MYKTTIEIDGMMCGMCENHVNETIRKAVPGAKKVKSSHTKGVSSFISDEEPDRDKIVAAIGDTGYTAKNVHTEQYTKKFFDLF